METSSVNELLQYSKLVSCDKNGVFKFHSENLGSILHQLCQNSELENPVAIVGVLGDEGSGKTILTNFLIQFLRKGRNSWTTTFSVDPETHDGFIGFDFGNHKPSNLYYTLSGSGIYMWPQLFQINVTGSPVSVIVLNAVGSSESILDRLDMFLLLICSRIVEIYINGDKVRLLDIWEKLQGEKIAEFKIKNYCKSIAYIKYAHESHIEDLTDDQHYENFAKFVSTLNKSTSGSKIEFKHFNFFELQENIAEIIKANGKLTKSPQIRNIKRVVQKVLEDNELPGNVLLNQIDELFRKIVNLFNEVTLTNLDNRGAREPDDSKTLEVETNDSIEQSTSNAIKHVAPGDSENSTQSTLDQNNRTYSLKRQKGGTDMCNNVPETESNIGTEATQAQESSIEGSHNLQSAKIENKLVQSISPLPPQGSDLCTSDESLSSYEGVQEVSNGGNWENEKPPGPLGQVTEPEMQSKNSESETMETNEKMPDIHSDDTEKFVGNNLDNINQAGSESDEKFKDISKVLQKTKMKREEDEQIDSKVAAELEKKKKVDEAMELLS